jgi:hypothetical protein
MSYVFQKRSLAAERGREGANRTSAMQPVRYDIVKVGACSMAKDIPRTLFQQRDIARSFLEERKPTPSPGTDLVAPTDDKRPPRMAFAERIVLYIIIQF